MKHPILVSGLLWLCVGLAFSASTPPDAINYQGVLRDSDDKPLAGTYSMIFRFFSAESGGDEILIDTHGTVTVSGGLFNVQLGRGAVVDGSGDGNYTSLAQVFRDYSDVYLQVEVAGETLLPRIQVLSSASALNSQYVKGQDLVSTGPLDLYVDYLTGDNTNDCLSLAAPCQTIQAAIDRIPRNLNGNDTVHIAAGTYEEDLMLSDISSPIDSRVTLQGEAGTVVNGSLTAQGMRFLVLDNLAFEGADYGLYFWWTYCALISCDLNDLGTFGIWGAFSQLYLQDTEITDTQNPSRVMRRGLYCINSYVAVSAGSQVTNATLFGIEALSGCKVEIGSNVAITNNGSLEEGGAGARASETGIVQFDLNAVGTTVRDNGPGGVGSQLIATDHGHVLNYSSVDFGTNPLHCDSFQHGICEEGGSAREEVASPTVDPKTWK